MRTLAQSTSLLSLLSDATRVRLLALLAGEELSVAELVKITELAQSRVSTHLAKLRDAGLLTSRRKGASTLHRASSVMPEGAKEIWSLVEAQLDDPLIGADRRRCRELVRARDKAWPDAVAGQMERHYSPGRTWEATARAFLGLSRFGDVLDAGSGDGTLAALIAPLARTVTCLDRSETVLEAAGHRLREQENVSFVEGDLLELPFDDGSFDHVMLFNVLTYTDRPARAIVEAARVLRAEGRLVAVTLEAHPHEEITAAYGHLVPGFETKTLRRHLLRAGLCVDRCEVTSRERRKPHFRVISAFAQKPSAQKKAAS